MWEDSVKLYYRDDKNKWIQFDSVEGYQCSISGDTIAVRTWDDESWLYVLQLYNYNPDLIEITSIQDPIRLVLSL